MKHSAEFLQIVQDARRRIQECTAQEVRALQERGEAFHLIDVREDHEYAAGHAQGAVHLGRGILERDIVGKIPDKNARIVLYCGGGFRSALAVDNLQRMGYRRVLSLPGGIRALRDAGFTIEQ
ncbi:MAG: rhodanese-like domain-containing protein [Acidobacteriota bacterium]